MPDEKRFLLHYSDYFTKNAPHNSTSIAIIFLIGIIAGVMSITALHYNEMEHNLAYALANGMSAGLLIISFPALVSAAIIKLVKRRIYLRHILMVFIMSTIAYSFFLVINSAIFFFLRSYIIAYIVILLANASLFGFWFIVSRFVMGKRHATLIALIYPTLNFLFYMPLGKYFINLNLPFWPAAIKLYSGMLIFLIVGYTFLYIVDRPAKKRLNISGVEIFNTMINQWLYNMGTLNFSLGIGTKKDIIIKILALKGKRQKAIFVEPGIHYGPFAGTGGANATEHLGSIILKKYGANPFILHSTVNHSNNPISTSEIGMMGKELEKEINNIKEENFEEARGGIGFGEAGPCKAIAIKINDAKLITLTKAPTVTEDIGYDVGEEFIKIAGEKSIIIDAHNSRIESANKEELKGIYAGSRYVEFYKKAIREALNLKKDQKLFFGSYSIKLSNLIKNAEDIGKGYTSVGVFKFGNENFAMIYFDANNMLPSLRERIINYVKEKYNIRCEVYTTDTHSVNSLNRPFTNVLGRKTKPSILIPILDIAIENALANMEEVKSTYRSFVIHNFAIWGEDAEEKLIETSKEILTRVKHIIPIVIAAGFVVAAWLIYFL